MGVPAFSWVQALNLKMRVVVRFRIRPFRSVSNQFLLLR